ncbi:Rpn family recombination-promoting nuclease/putative transposase [Spirulina sp. CCNP1310]|uniref:Rpn family recombination-promoting nuclease/putative transposase n=1 Tax=Spirulina sp. CCNP1310 TaxID=3110249 RepID=UPI002B201AA1|nr:Rpn family recombination-promoting nuclease/putative transposase [Spirulina sp. CCNP1310]MEA5418463.1 Rpn family recombination-promoting nuclease/putative transposase [Spirulina sp. CCNP1310]
MAFIDPRTEFAFKRIFGSAKSADLIVSLLNALLYESQPVIESTVVRDPYLTVQLPGVQHTPLTVRAKVNGGSACVIELQVLNLPTLGKRVLYNAAKSYGFQISREEVQRDINPLVALNIVDFTMFEQQPDVISRFTLQEVEKGFEYPNNELALVFVELPKFTKKLNELETMADFWIYFIQNAAKLETIPEPLRQVTEIRQAFALAREETLNREEFDILQQQLFFISDQRRSLVFGREEGLKEGVEMGKMQGVREGVEQGRELGIQEGIQVGRDEGYKEGIRQGKNQGIQVGRQEGIQQGQLGIIQRLLTRRFGKLESDVQAKLKALSGEQLEALAEAAWDFITDLELREWLDGHG